ncbi:MAG: hypothetical protein DYG89_12845 [Caldilinea sp. CFX5]|nr:hypothetical protein [Caldilinea sp. CFX5]
MNEIVVLDPRPDLQNGKVYLAEFDVDAPIPTVLIPLNGADLLRFDFGASYRKTFEEELYGLEFVDYRELPQRFQRYQPADQARIAARMIAVLAARQDGVDLETGPFAAKAMPLDVALATVAAWPQEH